MESHSRVNIRKTHPNLYRQIMTVGVMDLALAFNFWTAHPTFNPLPKTLVGLIFFLFGVGKLTFLNVFHNLPVVRLVLACNLGFMLFWGLINVQQWADGRASLQLPILYVAWAVVQRFMLVEAPVNPMTERE